MILQQVWSIPPVPLALAETIQHQVRLPHKNKQDVRTEYPTRFGLEVMPSSLYSIDIECLRAPVDGPDEPAGRGDGRHFATPEPACGASRVLHSALCANQGRLEQIFIDECQCDGHGGLDDRCTDGARPFIRIAYLY